MKCSNHESIGLARIRKAKTMIDLDWAPSKIVPVGEEKTGATWHFLILIYCSWLRCIKESINAVYFLCKKF